MESNDNQREKPDAELIDAIDLEIAAAVKRQSEAMAEVRRLKRKRSRLLYKLAHRGPVDYLLIDRSPA